MKVNSMLSIRNNQNLGSIQTWAKKPETSNNIPNQHNTEATKRFSMREQISNSRSRDINDSHLSTTVQDLITQKKKFSYLTSGTPEQQGSNLRNYSNEIKGKPIGGNNATSPFLNSNGQKNIQPQLPADANLNGKSSSYMSLTYAQTTGPTKTEQENEDGEISKNATLVSKSKEGDSADNTQKGKNQNQSSKIQYSDFQANYRNQDQEFQRLRRMNNEGSFGNGFTRRNSDNQIGQGDIRNDRANSEKRRDGMDIEGRELSVDRLQQNTNKYNNGKPVDGDTEKYGSSNLPKQKTNATEQRGYNNTFHTIQGFNRNVPSLQSDEIRGSSKERRALNLNAPSWEKNPNFNNKSSTEKTSPGNDSQASTENLIIRVINSEGNLEGKVFRIGDDLVIPKFFSGALAAQKPLSSLVVQDLTGKILANQELARVTISLEVKQSHEKEEVVQPIKIPVEEKKPDLLEKIMQLEGGNITPPTQTKRTAELPSTDASSNLIQGSLEKNESSDQGKPPATKSFANGVKKMNYFSSGSDDDEQMLTKQLCQNEANKSLSLKEKLAQNRVPPVKIESNIDNKASSKEQNKPGKLLFELDKKPVAWIIEEEKPRKQIKTTTFGAKKKIEPEAISTKQLTISAAKVPSDKPSSYKVLGQESVRFTRESNLLEKLENYIGKGQDLEKEIKQENAMTVEEQEADAAEKEAQKQLDEIYNFANRYFAANPTKTCNRCKLTGHFESMCPEAIKIMCIFCCGKHDTTQCKSYICFHCYNLGHKAQDCTEHTNLTCFRCNKKGHKNTECGVVLPPISHYDDEKVIREKNNARFTAICLTCGRNGHFNCNKNVAYGDTHKIDDIYTPPANNLPEPKRFQRNIFSMPNKPKTEFQPVPECANGNESDDSIDSADEKYLKRSGEKKNSNVFRNNNYLNVVNENKPEFNSGRQTRTNNPPKNDYSRSSPSKPRYQNNEFRKNYNNQDRNRKYVKDA